MSWPVIAGTISAILALSTLVPYLHDTLRGETRPSIISQSLWCLFALLAVVGQYASTGFTWSMAVALGTAFNNIIIVTVCLFGYGYRGHTRFDIASGLLALIGIFLWYVTDLPVYTVVFAVIANICAGIPTYRKTFKHPRTENTSAWLLVFGSALFSLFALRTITISSVAFPLFSLLEAILVVGLSLRRYLPTI
jgi:hypothetical protein